MGAAPYRHAEPRPARPPARRKTARPDDDDVIPSGVVDDEPGPRYEPPERWRTFLAIGFFIFVALVTAAMVLKEYDSPQLALLEGIGFVVYIVCLLKLLPGRG